MAVRRFNSQFNFNDVVGECPKGDYIVERDTFLSPRDILRKYSLGLPIGESALVQDEEYELPPDDLVDLFPSAGDDSDADEVVSAQDLRPNQSPAHPKSDISVDESERSEDKS